MPALLLFAVVIFGTIILSSYYSVLEWDGIGRAAFVGAENYLRLFTDKTSGFLPAVKNSFVLALLSLTIQVPIALLLALIISSGVPWENVFKTTYFIPVLLSATVIGQLWLKIYHPDYGLLNTVLRGIGLESQTQNWLGDADGILAVVFGPILWQWMGYHMLLLYTAIRAIPVSYFEAAHMEGAGWLHQSVQITVPLIRGALRVSMTLALIGSLKTFDLIYVLSGGGPVHASEVPAIVLFNRIFHHFEYGYGSAMAIFVVVECLLFTLLLQVIFRSPDYTY